jgi:cytochrome c553
MNPENGVGKGDDLEHGAKLYADNCVRCHGDQGQGDGAKFYPRLEGQHYEYLLRQYRWIKEGKRRNANPDMVEQIKNFTDKDTMAVLDYVSRLKPPADMIAPKGWKNPDFK